MYKCICTYLLGDVNNLVLRIRIVSRTTPSLTCMGVQRWADDIILLTKFLPGIPRCLSYVIRHAYMTLCMGFRGLPCKAVECNACVDAHVSSVLMKDRALTFRSPSRVG